MKVLITGGTGHIGTPVTKHLLAQGYDVLVIDTKAKSTVDAPYSPCDIMNFDAVLEAMTGCDAVVHLAALRSPAEAPAPDTFRINVAGTFNIYEAAASLGIKCVIQASSVNAWGCFWGNVEHEPRYLPIDEEHPFYTTDPYSFSKEMVEDVADYYWRRNRISSLSLRFPAVMSIEELESANFKAKIERTRAAIDAFAEQPELERQQRFEKLKKASAEYRVKLGLEYPNYRADNGADYLDDSLWLSYLFDRLNYWAILSTDDAARSFEKGLSANFTGSHALFISSARNYLGYDSQKLADLFFPELDVFKAELNGDTSLLNIGKAKTLIDFEPGEATWLE